VERDMKKKKKITFQFSTFFSNEATADIDSLLLFNSLINTVTVFISARALFSVWYSEESTDVYFSNSFIIYFFDLYIFSLLFFQNRLNCTLISNGYLQIRWTGLSKYEGSPKSGSNVKFAFYFNC